MMRAASSATRITAKTDDQIWNHFKKFGLGQVNQFGIALRNSIAIESDCHDCIPKVQAGFDAAHPLADHAPSRRNRSHNRLPFRVGLQRAVQNTPSLERNSSRGASIADQVWRRSFQRTDGSRFHLYAVFGAECLLDLRSNDNPKALTELMPMTPRIGAIADGPAASAQNDGHPTAAQVLTREHRVRAQVLTCPTSSAERTRNCGRVNVHGDAGGGSCMPARQTWGV
jgi:hypothetical protein